MAELRAAILAAGRGVRMGGAQPKTLIPVGDHEPLLHYLLRGLRVAGVEDLVVVTGFMPDAVQDFVSARWDEKKVSFIRNMRYASWGNFHSVRLAVEQSPGSDVMVVNSDIVVHPDVFERVAGAPGELVLAVEQRYGLDKEDMRVRLDGTRITDIGKELRIELSAGEYCGVSLLRGNAHRAYLEIATEIEWGHEPTLYYEDVFKRMLERVDARAAEVRSGEYAEVDDPDDMRDAARVLADHEAVWSTPAPAG